MTELDGTARPKKNKLLGGKNEARERIRPGEKKSRARQASLAQRKSQAGSDRCHRAMVRGPESKTGEHFLDRRQLNQSNKSGRLQKLRRTKIL
jgi:hypothetical protein